MVKYDIYPNRQQNHEVLNSFKFTIEKIKSCVGEIFLRAIKKFIQIVIVSESMLEFRPIIFER